MNKSKTTIFAVIAVVLGLLAMELITRGSFYFLGRYEGFRGAGWGYPSYIYAYRPYIGYAYQSSEDGRDQYGFSLDSNDDPQRDLTQKDACEFRIFMLGGSTVLGRHLTSKDDTLPARLERLLNEQSPPGIVYSVINTGKPAYISVQTFLEHALYIKYSLQPDLVIHFDGSNDSVGHPKYWPNEKYPGVRDNIPRYTEDVFSKINAITGLKGSLNALLRNLANYSAFMFALHKTTNDPDAWARWFLDVDVLKDETGGMSMTEWVEKHVNRYIYNVNLATRLGDRDTGVAYIFQPTMLPYMAEWMTPEQMGLLDRSDYVTEFHGYPLMDSKQLYYFRVREEFEKVMASSDSEFATITDLSRLFDDKTPGEYFQVSPPDAVHYLPKGKDIIAPAIAKIIQPSVEKQIQNDADFDQCFVGS